VIVQSTTYKCDVAGCDAPPFVETHEIKFRAPLARPYVPCVPSGWLYLDAVGIMCDRHGAKFKQKTRDFFANPDAAGSP